MVLLLLFAIAALAAMPSSALSEGRPADVLTTVASVHNLPREEAAKARPVHLIATVIYFQADHYSLYVADATGSAYVFPDHPGDLHRGDLVEITGVTEPSFRTIVAKSTIRVIGKGNLPQPTPADFRRLMLGDFDCQYVSVSGSVRSATVERYAGSQMAELVVRVPGGLIEAYIQDDSGVDLDALVDSDVRISGVAGGYFNGRNQLMRTVIHLSDKRELTVLKRPEVRPFDLPLTPIDKVIPSHYNIDLSKRVRVRGTVTFYHPANSIVIQNNGESLFALTYQVTPVPVGSVVDVIGFADNRGYGPMLGQAEIFPTGKSEVVVPKPLSYKTALEGKYSDDLITMHGTVLSELHGDLDDSMVVMVDEHPVNVSLWRKNGGHLPDLPVGTSVAVTGICRIVPTGAWGNFEMFQLNMRETADLQVLAQPSWWTVAHMLYVLAALLSISIIITGWALALRRRVSLQRERIERTVRMERERSRLLEQINSELPLEDLLEDICSSIGSLISGVQCTCELFDEDEAAITASRPLAQAPTQAPAHDPDTLFEAMLTGTTGHQVGVFRVRNTIPRSLSKEEQETLAIGTSLSNLAVNQRQLYQRLNYHSTHDQLTALPNRRLSDRHLEEALRAAKQSGQRIGVVYIDVDQFKQVNDKHGHKTGDLYLQQIAMRLSATVRARDILARIGGDEFLLTAELNNLEDGEAYKKRLQSCFDERFVLDGVTIYGSASIGLAVYPEHGTTAEELQRHADMEMYIAKQNDGPAAGKLFIAPTLR
jgi:diguanylate cyclase (GGDEF)-like protein